MMTRAAPAARFTLAGSSGPAPVDGEWSGGARRAEPPHRPPRSATLWIGDIASDTLNLVPPDGHGTLVATGTP